MFCNLVEPCMQSRCPEDWLRDIVPSKLRRVHVDTMVAGGEHEYTIGGFRRLIEEGCVDIVQPDIYRAGGPAALKKLRCSPKRITLSWFVMASAVRPTTSSPPTVRKQRHSRNTSTSIGALRTPGCLRTTHARKAGVIKPGDAPGFGYDLNSAAFNFNDGGKGVTPIW